MHCRAETTIKSVYHQKRIHLIKKKIENGSLRVNLPADYYFFLFFVSFHLCLEFEKVRCAALFKKICPGHFLFYVSKTFLPATNKHDVG